MNQALRARLGMMPGVAGGVVEVGVGEVAVAVAVAVAAAAVVAAVKVVGAAMI